MWQNKLKRQLNVFLHSTMSRDLLLMRYLMQLKTELANLFSSMDRVELEKHMFTILYVISYVAKEKLSYVLLHQELQPFLLIGGRTAHSAFKIPIEIHEGSTCNIKQNSDLAELIQVSDLIIWDEAPMLHRAHS